MAQLEKWAEICKLLGDKNRLTIIACLKERQLCVCELVELLGTSQPNISQHMRKLKDAGLVKEERRGQWMYYSLHMDDKPYLRALLDELPSQKEKLTQLSPISCS